MLRWLTIAAVFPIAALSGAAQAQSPADGGQIASRSAWVKVASCSRSDHSAAFYARMRRLAVGQRMRMRFTLLERGTDGRFAPVVAPRLDRWRKSKPGVMAFGYKQRVRGLTAGSFYRARVDYRWYDADGTFQRKARRTSHTCSQSGPLPNLRARITGSEATELPGVSRYTVRLANPGQVAVEAPKLRFTVEGSSSQTRTLSRLAAGGATLVSFRAAQCTTGARADADPANVVYESSEADNSQRLACADIPSQ